MVYQKRPEWLKVRLSGGNIYKEVKNLVNNQKEYEFSSYLERNLSNNTGFKLLDKLLI